QEVVDAYLAAVEFIHAAQRSGDDPGDELNRVLAEPFLSEPRMFLPNKRAKGFRIRPSGESKARVEVESVTLQGSTARIVDCVIDGYVPYAHGTARDCDVCA